MPSPRNTPRYRQDILECDELEPLDRATLFPVTTMFPDAAPDERRRWFCGPIAMSAVTGQPIEACRAWVNLVRRRDPDHVVGGLHNSTVLRALRYMGCATYRVGFERGTTLGKLREQADKDLRGRVLFINVTNHYLAVQDYDRTERSHNTDFDGMMTVRRVADSFSYRRKVKHVWYCRRNVMLARKRSALLPESVYPHHLRP